MAIQLPQRNDRIERPSSLDLGDARSRLEALLQASDGDKAELLPPLRHWLDSARAAIRSRFEADNDAEAAIADYCRLIDALIQVLLDHALAKVFRRRQSDRRRAHGGGRGGRLWPRGAGAVLRHRSAVPAPLQADGPHRADDRVPAVPALGSRPQGRAGDPLDRRLRAHRPRRSGGLHQSARGALSVGRRRAVRRVSRALPGRGGRRPWHHVRGGQARRARCPPPAHRRQPLPARAQRQGRQGRAARSADPVLAWSLSLRHRAAGAAGRARRAGRLGAAALHQSATVPLGGALPSALPERSAGGASHLRPAAGDRAAHGLSRSPGDEAASSAS